MVWILDVTRLSQNREYLRNEIGNDTISSTPSVL